MVTCEKSFLSVLRSAWLAQLGDLKTPNYLDHINGWQRLYFVIKVKQLVSIHKDPKSLVLAMDLNLYKWGKDRRESAKWDQIKRILCQSLRHIVNSVLKGNACLTLHDCLSQLNSDPFFGSPSAQITNNKHSLSSSIFTTLVVQLSAIQNHSVIGYYKGINQHAKAVILSGYISH